jgi:hypothetical protein
MTAQLFLLVKASPILRHSADDEHNYANYYQFKKQGGHHGVVVTSEHLSPGRWFGIFFLLKHFSKCAR